ncbi:MAG TPA: DUF4157 domain-containing protein, partial [Actinomycetales bacterium]|nr:DUF4157 domain-containing protein [Actinomycetales bacterium]
MDPRLVPTPRPKPAPAVRTGPDRPSPAEVAGLSALRSLLSRSEGEPAPAWARSIVRDLTGRAPVGARVHRGPEANRVASLLETDGATVGPHVVLGAAATESTLVHELVHVVQGPEPPDLAQPLELGPREAEAEAEARAVTAGGGVGVRGRPGNVVRRSTELTGSEYLTTHEAQLEQDLVARLKDPLLPLPLPATTPAARWPEGGSARFLGAVGEKLRVGALETTLARVLPRPPVHIVDDARVKTTQLMAPESQPKEVSVWETDHGPSDYFPTVAMALADAVYQQVVAALPRMIERYLAALRRHFDAEIECSPVDNRLPAFSLVTTHPIDTVLAEVLVTHTFLTVDTAVLLVGPVATVPSTVEDLRPVRWTHLGPEGLERWIRVIEPADPTAEEVAHALYGRTDAAHVLTVVGTLVGFASTAEMLPAVQAMLAVAPLQPVATTPLDQLMASSLGDEASLATSTSPRPGVGATEVFADLRVNLVLLVDMATLAQRFGLGRALTPAREHADALGQRLAESDAQVVVRWDGLVRDQRAVLVGATFGLSATVSQLDAMNQVQEDVGGFTMPQFARRALRDGAEGFVEAAALSHVPTLARQALIAAEERWRLLPATLAEGMLMGVVDTLHDAGRAKVHSISYDPQTVYELPVMRARLDALRQRVQVLRAQLLADPDSASAGVQVLMDDVRDLADEVQVVGVMDQMFAAWQALHDTNTFAAFLAFQSGDLRELQRESLDWFAKWSDVRVHWLAGRHDEARSAAQALAKDPAFISFLERVQAEIEDAQSKALIAQIVLMVAITLATMGIGAYVGGVVGGAMAGSRFAAIAAGGAAAVAEGVAITTLQTLLLTPPDQWSLDRVAIDLAWNIATFGALRGVASKLRAAGFMRSLQTGSRTGRFVAFGIEHSTNMVVLGGSEIGRALVEEAAGHGPPLTQEQITERLEQGVLAYILIASVGALAKSPLEAIQHRGLTRGLRINELRRLRLAMEDAAGRLQVKAMDIDVAVLRRMVRQYWEATRATTEQLLADPAALGKSGLQRAEVERLHAVAGQMAAESATFRLASRMQRVGPAHFLVARTDMPRLLALRQATGSSVREAGRDSVSGIRTYEVTSPDGTIGRFTETLGAARAGEVEGGLAPTAPEARAAREEMFDAIRVQARRSEQLTALVNARLEASETLEVRHLVVGEGQ